MIAVALCITCREILYRLRHILYRLLSHVAATLHWLPPNVVLASTFVLIADSICRDYHLRVALIIYALCVDCDHALYRWSSRFASTDITLCRLSANLIQIVVKYCIDYRHALHQPSKLFASSVSTHCTD